MWRLLLVRVTSHSMPLRNEQTTLLPPRLQGDTLGFMVGKLSDQNYTQSLDFCRFWFDTGRTYIQIPSDQMFDAIWNNRAVGSSIDLDHGQLIRSTAHLILRFASDAESDHILAPYSSGLQHRLCTRSLRDFSRDNLMAARYGSGTAGYFDFYAGTNLIAHWANLGCVDMVAIRDHILQSLISTRSCTITKRMGSSSVQVGGCHI